MISQTKIGILIVAFIFMPNTCLLGMDEKKKIVNTYHLSHSQFDIQTKLIVKWSKYIEEQLTITCPNNPIKNVPVVSNSSAFPFYLYFKKDYEIEICLYLSSHRLLRSVHIVDLKKLKVIRDEPRDILRTNLYHFDFNEQLLRIQSTSQRNNDGSYEYNKDLIIKPDCGMKVLKCELNESKTICITYLGDNQGQQQKIALCTTVPWSIVKILKHLEPHETVENMTINKEGNKIIVFLTDDTDSRNPKQRILQFTPDTSPTIIKSTLTKLHDLSFKFKQ